MINLFTIRSLVLNCFISIAGIGSTYAQTEKFSFNKFINKGDTLNYRMLFPLNDTLQKYPLVIFLHGSGERGNDNEAQLKWGVMNFASDQIMKQYPSFIVAPQCSENLDWYNFDGDFNSRKMRLKATPSKPMKLIIELLQELVKNNAIDTNRIYITGLSMGGAGTYDAMQRYPRLFAAAVPVCGFGDVSKAALMAHIPTWIFHGALDPAVDPRYSYDMLGALIQAGAHPGFTQYPEVDHFSWIPAYADTMMMEWLYTQRKK